METVKSLRQKGYKVRVLHNRRYKGKFSNDFEEKGGKTTVEIRTPEGIEISASARCHEKDNYNKKEGVRIALKRALHDVFKIKEGQVWQEQSTNVKYLLTRVCSYRYCLVSLENDSNRYDDPSNICKIKKTIFNNNFVYKGTIDQYI
jgi:hypothetical protein